MPQVRVALQLFEIDRDRLFQFSSEVQGLVSDFNQPALNPSNVGNNIQTNPASVGAFSDSDVQAGLASLANGFSQQIQVNGRRFALDTLLQALEARGIARRPSCASRPSRRHRRENRRHWPRFVARRVLPGAPRNQCRSRRTWRAAACLLRCRRVRR